MKAEFQWTTQSESTEMVVEKGNNGLMTPEQLAKRMDISLRMVREKYCTNNRPHLRLYNRTVRFSEAHYEQILELSKQWPVTPIRKTITATKAAELAELFSGTRAA
jgi:hypothetical protein